MEKDQIRNTEPIREYFPFYYSFKDALQEVEESDRLALYDGITNYAFFGKEPELKSVVSRGYWKLIKPLLEKSQRNYQNGSKGGAPKGSRNNPNGRRGKSAGTNRELTEELTETNRELSNKDNDNENEKEKDNDIVVSDKQKPHTTNRMARPSVEEISEYMREKGETDSDNEAQAFFDYYDSKGWLIGKTPMKRWRSAVGTWLRNKPKFDGNGKSKQYSTKSSQADNIARAQQFAFSEMESTVI